MSGGADAGGGGAAGAGGNAPAGAASPAPAGATPAQVHSAAENALQDRMHARRQEAERMIGYDDAGRGERGPDGKFKAKADAGAKDAAKPAPKDSSGTADKKAKPPEEAKADPQAEPEESPSEKKLKGEHEALKKSHDALKKRDGEWEEMAGQVIARLDSYKQRISYLEQKLAEAGQAPDAGVLENLSLKEQLRARELKDERAKSIADKQAEEQRQAALNEERGQLTDAFKKIWNDHPELRPPFTDQTAEASQFWRGIQQAIANGANFTALAPILAAAPALASSIKAKTAPAAKPRVTAPTIIGSRQSGGEPRAVDRFDIVEKHKARLRAG